jgi:hypothetical protein
MVPTVSVNIAWISINDKVGNLIIVRKSCIFSSMFATGRIVHPRRRVVSYPASYHVKNRFGGLPMGKFCTFPLQLTTKGAVPDLMFRREGAPKYLPCGDISSEQSVRSLGTVTRRL